MAVSLVLPIQTILSFTRRSSLASRREHNSRSKCDLLAVVELANCCVHLIVNLRPFFRRYTPKHRTECHGAGLHLLPDVFGRSRPCPGKSLSLFFDLVEPRFPHDRRQAAGLGKPKWIGLSRRRDQ